MFEGTNLEKNLKVIGARVLMMTGFLTDFCIEATVRSANDRGYIPVTIADACATQNEELQETALKRIQANFGPVADTGEILGLIGDHTAQRSPAQPRTFNIAEIGPKLASGISMNDIVDWKGYMKPEETALLVVDPLEGFIRTMEDTDTSDNTETGKAACANIKNLISSCRNKSISIFWAGYSGGQEPGSPYLPKGCGKFFTGENDTDFIGELGDLVSGEDVILGKSGWSAFEGTALESGLCVRGIKNLIVCGFLTDLGVESTVRNAADRGYFTIIATDACAALTPELHEQALLRFDRLIGPILETESLVQFMDQL